MNKSVVLKPRLSEKAYSLSEELNTYLFEVPSGVNSLSVADAVAKQYSVSVIKVRITGAPAKTKRTYRRGGRVSHRARRSDFRKAYVVLKEGDKLPIFAAVEEPETKPETKGKK
ncbi:MAG: 50S ribosomal protein L23 [Candidatus Saccharimonadales bacterium]|jgi:ribosomal protein L23